MPHGAKPGFQILRNPPPVHEAFQFDWSEECLVIGGIYRRMQVSHLKLCASRAFWLAAYPSQGHEMLFDAHTRSFAALGGSRHAGTGTCSHDAQPQLPIRSLNEIRIPLPPLATQQAIVAEIEAEQALVNANIELIARFEKKIQTTLARFWGATE